MPKPEPKLPDGCEKIDVEKSGKPKETVDEMSSKIIKETTTKSFVESEKMKSPIKEITIQPEIYTQPPTFRWKPAEYPADPKFKGFVTNIGDDGSIQLHVVREGN